MKMVAQVPTKVQHRLQPLLELLNDIQTCFYALSLRLVHTLHEAFELAVFLRNCSQAP